MLLKMSAMKILLLCFVISINLLKVTGHGEDDFCDRDEVTGACKKRSSSFDDDDDEDDEPCWNEEPSNNKEDSYRLVRLDGVKVGHEQYSEIDGKKYKLITRAMRPLLFEVPDFLTEDEVSIIRDEAVYSGMFTSWAKGGLTEPDDYKPIRAPGRSAGASGKFKFWDFDLNGIINLEDILNWTRYHSFLKLNETDIKDMFAAINETAFDDGIITREEFKNLNTQGVDDYLNVLVREHPRFRQRFSDQTYISFSKSESVTAHKIRERAMKLTKLPRKVIYGSEHMQVVRYGVNGHYHAHQDSETHTRMDKPCCHLTNMSFVAAYGTCRLCRFMTILFYLGDTEEGGETAFPVADNATFSTEALRRRSEQVTDVKDFYNLSDHCKDANLVVSPRRGKAVMWYNHLIDENSGWLGELEDRALHGGCDVTKGEKWIANLWITAPYAHEVHKPSMYFDEDDYLEAEKAYS